jgi:hypothetical protein
MEIGDRPIMTPLVQIGLFGEENCIRSRGIPRSGLHARPITRILRFATNVLVEVARKQHRII